MVKEVTHTRIKMIPWPALLVSAGLAWGFATAILQQVRSPSAVNMELLARMITGVLFGAGAWMILRRRRSAQPVSLRTAQTRAVLWGMVYAVYVLLSKLSAHTSSGAPDQLPHLVTILLDVFWYAGLISIFTRVQVKQRFSVWVVIVLVGVYQLGMDGILRGQILPAMFGEDVPLMRHWANLLGVRVWQFMAANMPVLLAPAAVLANPAVIQPTEPEVSAAESGPAWMKIMMSVVEPLLWLAPTAVLMVGWVMFNG